MFLSKDVTCPSSAWRGHTARYRTAQGPRRATVWTPPGLADGGVGCGRAICGLGAPRLPQPTALAPLLIPPAEITWKLGTLSRALFGRINPIAFQTLASPCKLPLQSHCPPVAGWSLSLCSNHPGHMGGGTVDPFYRRQMGLGCALTGEPDPPVFFPFSPVHVDPFQVLEPQLWEPPYPRRPSLPLVTHHPAGTGSII